MEIGVLGCAGRMGRAVMAEILASPDARLAGGVEVPGHPALGHDLGVLAGAEPLGLVASDDCATGCTCVPELPRVKYSSLPWLRPTCMATVETTTVPSRSSTRSSCASAVCDTT